MKQPSPRQARDDVARRVSELNGVLGVALKLGPNARLRVDVENQNVSSQVRRALVDYHDFPVEVVTRRRTKIRSE